MSSTHYCSRHMCLRFSFKTYLLHLAFKNLLDVHIFKNKCCFHRSLKETFVFESVSHVGAAPGSSSPGRLLGRRLARLLGAKTNSYTLSSFLIVPCQRGGVHDLQIFLKDFLKEFRQDFGTIRIEDS